MDTQVSREEEAGFELISRTYRTLYNLDTLLDRYVKQISSSFIAFFMCNQNKMAEQENNG